MTRCVSGGAYTDNPQVGEPAVPLETWTGVTMHELGHNLGLLHGGLECTNQKPNYLSVMNYDFYGGGLIQAAYRGATTYKTCQADADCGGEPYHCSEATDPSDPSQCGNPNDPTTCPHWCYHVDYSDKLFNPLNKNNLDETVGLQGYPGSLDLTFLNSNGGLNGSYAPTDGTPIDWNHDGSYVTSVCADVSGNGIGENCGSFPTLLPANDWLSHIEGATTVFDNLQFSYQCTGNYAH